MSYRKVLNPDYGKMWLDSNITSDKFYSGITANNGNVITGSFTDGGIYYSTDNGITWQSSSLTSGKYSCFCKAQNGNIIACRVDTNSYGGTSDAGIYYSTDNGVTWQKSTDTYISGKLFTILIVTEDGTIFAASSSNTKLQRSIDNGISWSSIDITNVYAICSPAANKIVICNSSGFKYSTDNGVTWQNSNLINDSYNTYMTEANILAVDSSILVASVYVSTNAGSVTCSIMYSIDCGITWQSSNITSIADGGYCQCFIKAQDGKLISSSNHGIKYSTDNGITWQSSNLTSGQYYKIADTKNGIILAISKTDGIKYSTDNGVTWQNSSITSERYADFIITSNSVIACSYEDNGIKYSLLMINELISSRAIYFGQQGLEALKAGIDSYISSKLEAVSPEIVNSIFGS